MDVLSSNYTSDVFFSKIFVTFMVFDLNKRYCFLSVYKMRGVWLWIKWTVMNY